MCAKFYSSLVLNYNGVINYSKMSHWIMWASFAGGSHLMTLGAVKCGWYINAKVLSLISNNYTLVSYMNQNQHGKSLQQWLYIPTTKKSILLIMFLFFIQSYLQSCSCKSHFSYQLYSSSLNYFRPTSYSSKLLNVPTSKI